MNVADTIVLFSLTGAAIVGLTAYLYESTLNGTREKHRKQIEAEREKYDKLLAVVLEAVGDKIKDLMK